MNIDLKEIFRKVFLLEEGYTLETLKEGDIENWDSLGHITLFMELENKLGIKFKMDEIAKNRSYKDIKRLLEEKGILCI